MTVIIIACIGWASCLAACFYAFRLSHHKIRLESQISEFQNRFESQQKAYELAQQKMEQSFKSLAGEALAQSSENFLKLATERLDKKTVEAKSTFEEKVTQFQKMVEPIKQVMAKVENDLGRVEKERLEQFSRISEQLIAIGHSSENLRKEANSLSSALRKPEVRGSWGELKLRRVVELAGMSAYCDFEEQVFTKTAAGIQKPDMIVRLPNQRQLVVDSKVPQEAYSEALIVESPQRRTELLQKHSKSLRNHVTSLSRKSYWEQFEQAPDFAILFIPTEASLYAAMEVDAALIEDAMKERIVIATPTTLVALLKAVAYGWQQTQSTENAQKILLSAKELYDRLNKWIEHVSSLGEKLEAANKSYNSAVGSLESRVMPSLRRLNDLGIGSQEDLTKISAVETMTRKIEVPALVLETPSVNVGALKVEVIAIETAATVTVDEGPPG